MTSPPDPGSGLPPGSPEQDRKVVPFPTKGAVPPRRPAPTAGEPRATEKGPPDVRVEPKALECALQAILSLETPLLSSLALLVDGFFREPQELKGAGAAEVAEELDRAVAILGLVRAFTALLGISPISIMSENDLKRQASRILSAAVDAPATIDRSRITRELRRALNQMFVGVYRQHRRSVDDETARRILSLLAEWAGPHRDPLRDDDGERITVEGVRELLRKGLLDQLRDRHAIPDEWWAQVKRAKREAAAAYPERFARALREVLDEGEQRVLARHLGVASLTGLELAEKFNVKNRVHEALADTAWGCGLRSFLAMMEAVEAGEGVSEYRRPSITSESVGRVFVVRHRLASRIRASDGAWELAWPGDSEECREVALTLMLLVSLGSGRPQERLAKRTMVAVAEFSGRAADKVHEAQSRLASAESKAQQAQADATKDQGHAELEKADREAAANVASLRRQLIEWVSENRMALAQDEELARLNAALGGLLEGRQRSHAAAAAARAEMEREGDLKAASVESEEAVNIEQAEGCLRVARRTEAGIGQLRVFKKRRARQVVREAEAATEQARRNREHRVRSERRSREERIASLEAKASAEHCRIGARLADLEGHIVDSMMAREEILRAGESLGPEGMGFLTGLVSAGRMLESVSGRLAEARSRWDELARVRDAAEEERAAAETFLHEAREAYESLTGIAAGTGVLRGL